MTTIARVIVDASLMPRDLLSEAEIESFSIGGKTFYRLNSPNQNAINTARKAINNGHSAAIIKNSALHPTAIFLDMDGTVIKEESLVEISKVSGKKEEIEKLTEMAMAGKMDFIESLNARLKILKGITKPQVLSIRPTIAAGMHGLAAWCRTRDIKLFMVSGGFTELAAPVAKTLQLNDFLANRFAWDGDIMQGRTEGAIIDAGGKKNALIQWCQSYNIRPETTLAIGDGANDLLMMQASGLAVGFMPKPFLWHYLDVSNQTGDHEFLVECLR